MTRKESPTGTVLYTYDEAARLTKASSPQSDLQLLGYRADGKLAWMRSLNYRTVGAQCNRFEVRQDFSYDPSHGRLSSEDISLWELGMTAPLEKWTEAFGYDGAGQVTEVTYPYCRLATCTATVRNQTTQYEMGRPIAVPGFASVPGSPSASAITYHPNGLVKTVQHANGVVFTQTTDPSGMARPGSLRVDLGATHPWPREDFGYDGSGNITRVGGKKFSYDASSRLTSALLPGASPPYQAYLYDVFGNLTRVSKGTNASNVTSYVDYTTNGATNRLQGASYDGSGNLTNYQGSTYTWDVLGRLAAIDTGSERWVHTYDAAGERVWSWRTTGTRVDTFALRGLGSEVLSDFTKTGSAYTWEDYVYREGNLLGAILPTGQTIHFDVDHLGSTRLETYGDGSTKVYRDYWPYGDIALASVPTSADTEQMRFTGHERDIGDPTSTADDVDYMHARYYKPLFGRFLTPDPASANARRPQTWNRYAYVLGNPLRFTDPSGMTVRASDQQWGVLECIANLAACASAHFDALFAETFPVPGETIDLRNVEAVGEEGVPPEHAKQMTGSNFEAIGTQTGLNTFGSSATTAVVVVGAVVATDAIVSRIGTILRPAGEWIGAAGRGKEIREIAGGAAQAEAMFARLSEGGTVITGTRYPGTLVEFSGGGRIGLRLASKSGPPTIDLNIAGISLRKLKFVAVASP